MFAALSDSEAAFTTYANKSLQKIFGSDKFSTTAILLNMMYTGPLPEQYYMESFDMNEEMKFLSQSLENLRILATVTVCVISSFLAIILFLIIDSCIMRRQLRKVNELEIKVTKEMAAKKKKMIKKTKEKFDVEQRHKQEMLKNIIALKNRAERK
jgi:hypothetical protein